MAMVGLYNLCPPAMLYFALSITVIVVIILQNIGSGSQYCVGTMSCSSSTALTTGFFVIKVLYVLVWTWVINVLCQNGYNMISWALVLIPLVLMFIFMALFMLGTFDIGVIIPSIHIFN